VKVSHLHNDTTPRRATTDLADYSAAARRAAVPLSAVTQPLELPLLPVPQLSRKSPGHRPPRANGADVGRLLRGGHGWPLLVSNDRVKRPGILVKAPLQDLRPTGQHHEPAHVFGLRSYQ
jgi:hypothetical protein